MTTYKDELRYYIAEARKKGGRPVLVTSTNRRRFDENGKIINTLERISGGHAPTGQRAKYSADRPECDEQNAVRNAGCRKLEESVCALSSQQLSGAGQAAGRTIRISIRMALTNWPNA